MYFDWITERTLIIFKVQLSMWDENKQCFKSLKPKTSCARCGLFDDVINCFRHEIKASDKFMYGCLGFRMFTPTKCARDRLPR